MIKGDCFTWLLIFNNPPANFSATLLEWFSIMPRISSGVKVVSLSCLYRTVPGKRKKNLFVTFSNHIQCICDLVIFLKNENNWELSSLHVTCMVTWVFQSLYCTTWSDYSVVINFICWKVSRNLQLKHAYTAF